MFQGSVYFCFRGNQAQHLGRFTYVSGGTKHSILIGSVMFQGEPSAASWQVLLCFRGNQTQHLRRFSYVSGGTKCSISVGSVKFQGEPSAASVGPVVSGGTKRSILVGPVIFQGEPNAASRQVQLCFRGNQAQHLSRSQQVQSMYSAGLQYEVCTLGKKLLQITPGLSQEVKYLRAVESMWVVTALGLRWRGMFETTF